MRFAVKTSDDDPFDLRAKCERFINEELLIPDSLTIDERADFAVSEFKYALEKATASLFVSVIEDPPKPRRR